MKILYAIAGEGMGHAVRSSVIIDHLISKNHDVHIISSGKPFDFLNSKYNNCSKITGLTISYKENKIDKFKTILNNLKSSKDIIKNIKTINKTFKNVKPKLVITDFESSACYYAKIFKIPVISIDNIQSINRCKVDKKLKNKNYKIAKSLTKARTPGCQKYLITSFFENKIIKKDTNVYNPIIRKQIINKKPEYLDHILVYNTSDLPSDLIKKLNKTNENYIIYQRNCEKENKVNNLLFKPFNEISFIKDLSECKAVICGGGFTVISESLYLKKPILSIPIKDHFEQEMNAFYVEKLGYGMYCELNDVNINKFLKRLSFYKDNLKDYKHDNNEKILKNINSIIESIK
jgi:uncharacterized protein (TIGR00661 family)